MARKPRILAAQVAAAEQVVRVTRDARELRQAQAVLLPAQHGLSLAATGQVTGRSKATVTRMLAESSSGQRTARACQRGFEIDYVAPAPLG